MSAAPQLPPSQPEQDASTATPVSTVIPAKRPWLLPLLLLAIAAIVLLTPWPLDRKMRWVGAACCAQAPARTLRIGGLLMPLDARDVALYLSLAVTVGLSYLVGRGRASLWPPRQITSLLGGLFLAMVADGFNSSLETMGHHALYHTDNILRVITGAGAGLALGLLALPAYHRLVWKTPENEQIVSDYSELGGFLVGTVVVIALLLTPPARLYYPLSLLSVLAMLGSWSLANSCVIAVSLRREQRLRSRYDLLLLLLGGLLLTLGETALIDLLRGGVY